MVNYLVNLFRRQPKAASVLSTKEAKKIVSALTQQTVSLTRKDIDSWHSAWQTALNIDNPSRIRLYDCYDQAMIDLHLSGCIEQRKDRTLQSQFVIKTKDGKEVEELHSLFGGDWFTTFISLALDSIFYGHSLIQLDGITGEGAEATITGCSLVPRRHVIPEAGVFTENPGDDQSAGISYREGIYADWVVEVGDPLNLGLLLKLCPPAISKKNMLAYWDTFGEMFGMPLRWATTPSQDKKEWEKIGDTMDNMGSAFWGLFADGTDFHIEETTRGDSFNVYDKRVDRCNSEISKGILGQTMTIDNGSSLSQSTTHLDVLKKICRNDSIYIQNVINTRLFPVLIRHGFALEGCCFAWDSSEEANTSEQREMERLLMQYYDIDPAYFIDKYNIPIIGKRVQTPETQLARPDVDSFFA